VNRLIVEAWNRPVPATRIGHGQDGSTLQQEARLRAPNNPVIRTIVKTNMPTSQEQYDDAMFAFSQGDYDDTIARLQALLAVEPAHFDAQLALGMAYYRKGDYAAAIAEGHKAEKLQPREQLVHTNLSLFYMKAGDKQTAEHHGLQARIAGWRDHMAPPSAGQTDEPELQMARPKPPPIPKRDMPWKKNAPIASPPAPSGPTPDKPA
jgi:tetratricopeptide (TPR) repeat protein